MAKIRPSATKALNYVLTTFLVALPAMVMVYKWGMAR
jgi:hypothetical protein